jgi:hypothetical protein
VELVGIDFYFFGHVFPPSDRIEIAAAVATMP